MTSHEDVLYGGDIITAFEKIKVRELVVLGHMRIFKFDTVSAYTERLHSLLH